MKYIFRPAIPFRPANEANCERDFLGCVIYLISSRSYVSFSLIYGNAARITNKHDEKSVMFACIVNVYTEHCRPHLYIFVLHALRAFRHSGARRWDELAAFSGQPASPDLWSSSTRIRLTIWIGMALPGLSGAFDSIDLFARRCTSIPADCHANQSGSFDNWTHKRRFYLGEISI